MTFTVTSLRSSLKGSPVITPRLSREDEQYIHLLAKFCELADVSLPESVMAGEEFSIGQIDFRLRRDEKKAPEMINVWCDFGPVRQQDQLDCYRSLLERDGRYHGFFYSTMAICPQTGWVVCSARAHLSEVDAEALFDYLLFLAKEALCWQSSRTNRDFPSPAGQERQALMPGNALVDLVLDYCSLFQLGRDAAEAILSGTPVIVDDVAFIFAYGIPDRPDTLSLYCDYGGMDSRHESREFYRTLLSANMLMFPALGQTMLLSGESKHLLLRQDLSLKTTKAVDLQKSMAVFVKKILYWRTLSEASPSAGGKT